jgi:transcription-repair coupling factor (superfamily II helicase)
LDQIFQELNLGDKYSIQDCKVFGNAYANYDIKKGIRRILSYSGPFEPNCRQCLYYKYGFIQHDFAPGGIDVKTVDAFVESYNNAMRRLLPKDAIDEIMNFKPKNDFVFSSDFIFDFTPTFERITDSTIKFRLHSDRLESLFKEQIDSLIISISSSLNRMKSVEYYYQEIKNNGMTIVDKKQDVQKFYITLDFRNVPANYDICWCKALEQKYRLNIPIKYK